jgi:hypothetical protein
LFNVVTAPTFTRDVPVSVPSGDGYVEQSFKATFQVLSDEERDARDLSVTENVKAYLREIILHLDDLTDDEGQPVPYGPEILEQILGFGYVRIALLSTYTKAQIKAVTGN